MSPRKNPLTLASQDALADAQRVLLAAATDLRDEASVHDHIADDLAAKTPYWQRVSDEVTEHRDKAEALVEAAERLEKQAGTAVAA